MKMHCTRIIGYSCNFFYRKISQEIKKPSTTLLSLPNFLDVIANQQLTKLIFHFLLVDFLVLSGVLNQLPF